MDENILLQKPELELNESAKEFLREAAKWAYFLSILGFIGIGLIVLVAIFAGTIFSAIGSMTPGMGGFGSSFGIVLTVVYLIIALLYFFPVYYMNKFATNAKTALQENDTESLALSFEYLKSHYKFIGIMSIIGLCLYGLIIVFAIIAALAR
ncbi:DUF5362 family protein [Flavobacterium sp.]|uniref:DUF5362 family protein n=1 Tax=Flavobacterium sp. TaxID=239 RepID=UPI00286B5A9D|nr:DUF5362 family protein [Flavobacterium sp.]